MNGKAKLVRMSWLAVALLPLLIDIAGAANRNQSNADQQNNQTTNPNQPVTPSGPMRPSHPFLEKADNLIGAKVVNERGEQLGTVEDIVLTPDHSAVNYVVLSHGWSWGTGGKVFAVPWSQFQFRPGEKVLILSNVSKADLEQAKGFDRSHWPATANENWLGIPRGGMTPPALGYVPPSGNEGATATPGTPAYGEQAPAQPRPDQYQSRDMTGAPMTPQAGEPSGTMAYDIRDFRVSEMTGKAVRDLQGERLGKLDDLVIDTQQGKVAFGIVSMRTGVLGLGKDYAAVPWPAFQFTERGGAIRLDTTPQTLAAIAFKADNFPDLADPQYSRQLYERFGVTPYYGETLGFVPGQTMERGGSSAALYNPSEVQTIHGTIESLGTYPLPGTSVEGLLLNIKTDDGRTVAVQAGPRPYVEKQNFTFHQGDEVTIIGARAVVAGRNVILASQIKMGDKTLNLLTKEGKPLWKLEEFQSAKELQNTRESNESHAPAYGNY
jgi:sporulation protein YlmC with PRC-barrel domain